MCPVVTRPLVALETKLARLAELGDEAWPKTLVFPELRQDWVAVVEDAFSKLDHGEFLEVLVGVDLESLSASGVPLDVAQAAVNRLHSAQEHAFDQIEVWDLADDDETSGSEDEGAEDEEEDSDDWDAGSTEVDEDQEDEEDEEEDGQEEEGQEEDEGEAFSPTAKRVVAIRLVA